MKFHKNNLVVISPSAINSEATELSNFIDSSTSSMMPLITVNTYTKLHSLLTDIFGDKYNMSYQMLKYNVQNSKDDYITVNGFEIRLLKISEYISDATKSSFINVTINKQSNAENQ